MLAVMTPVRAPISQEKIRELAAQAAPLARGFDFVADHVVITDEHANILYANRAAEQNTGFSAGEMLGKTPGDLWGGRMPREFYDSMWRTIKGEKKPFVGEVRNVKKDGSEYWQELHISPILDERGNVKFFVAIEPNITDRKEKERFREEFIGIVGHQLRNPLVSMRWLLELVLARRDLTREEREEIRDAYEKNAEMSGLVGDLLALARAEKASEQPKEAVNLTELVEQVVADARERHPAVTFSVSAIGSMPVSANRVLAAQVFSNLITNAAEYADKAMPQVAIALAQEDSNYIFSCYNNGIEIAPEDAPRVFTRFFRAQAAVEAKKSGTGLGLFIVKTIAEGLGWRVSFESGKGQGTTFYVRIPKRPPHMPSSPQNFG